MGAGADLLVWYKQKGGLATLVGPASLYRASLAQEGRAKGPSACIGQAVGVREVPPVFSGVLVRTGPVCLGTTCGTAWGECRAPG